jgi:phosphate transport system ATP-binding protein
VRAPSALPRGGPASSYPIIDAIKRGETPTPRIHDSVQAEPVILSVNNFQLWYGQSKALHGITMPVAKDKVTALIGPSGCGKSTLLRSVNRLNDLIEGVRVAGSIDLNGNSVYARGVDVIDLRKRLGMVFQKPNPFPTMSIYDNVLAGLKFVGIKPGRGEKDSLVEECLTKAGLWKEVQNRLRSPGGGLSGGQQQRLCIARSLAVKPKVLLMDEPCSALDPTSTRRVEETILEIKSEVTIVIVTHNMQQANRVSDRCAFFLAEQGKPGYIVESGDTEAMFNSPQDPRTFDYVNGLFG